MGFLSREDAVGYANRIARQDAERQEQERVAAVEAVREREQMLTDADQRRQDKIREEDEERTRQHEAEKERMRLLAQQEDAQKMAALATAEQRHGVVVEELRRLGDDNNLDLGSPDALDAAIHRAIRRLALRELLETTSAQLRTAQRACGRHTILRSDEAF